MNGIINHIKLLLVLSTLGGLFYGCQSYKAVSAINNVEVKTSHCTFYDKHITMVPLAHYGKEAFFSSLKDSITAWKKENYKICYEQIKMNINSMDIDSIAYGYLLLKWRKINGGFTDYNKRHAQMDKTFDNCITQPGYKELGIDSLDVNVDITLEELVVEFENYYGTIELDSCDYTTHFDSVYTCGEKLNVDFRPVIVDFRNEQVVKKINNLESTKLVVLFGAAHIPGIRKLLNERNKRALPLRSRAIASRGKGKS